MNNRPSTSLFHILLVASFPLSPFPSVYGFDTKEMVVRGPDDISVVTRRPVSGYQR